MPPARPNSFAQWAEQTYGPSSKPAPKAPMVSALEQLVARKHLDGSVSPSPSAPKQPALKSFMVLALEHLVARKYLERSISHHPCAPKQPTPASSDSDATSASRDNDSSPPASTQKTTPDRSSRNSPESSAPTNRGPIPLPRFFKSPKWYQSLDRFEQLEYYVTIKIEAFREHVGVHIPDWSRLCYIDWEEEERRRYFYLKHGEVAYWSRYINSNYTGHNEFLYIDPKEVQWK